jgi:hypothetical protein
MDSGTLSIILGLTGILITVIIGANKFIVKNNLNIKNVKDSHVDLNNINIGKGNKIVKGDVHDNK